MKVISNDADPSGQKRRQAIAIRKMEIDDLAPVFHLGEQLFTAQRVPNLYRTWDEFEVISSLNLSQEQRRLSQKRENGHLRVNGRNG